jgi:hypothetical protein
MKRLSLFLFAVLFSVIGLNAQTVVLYEDFSAIIDSTGSTITNTLDTCTNVPGWTGDWVYPSYGKVRVGKSSAGGFLMTPALDLSANNGNFTVTFDVKAWNNDQTRMYVEVDGVEYLVNGLSTTQFNTYTLDFTGGTSASTVKFKSYQATKARFFLDNVVITTQASGPDTVGPFVSSVGPSTTGLAVTFNEDLDPVSAENANNYVLDNNVTVTSATLNGHVVNLGVSPAIQEGHLYTLIVSNVADAEGNVMSSPDTVTFSYGIDPQFHVASIAELRAKWTSPLDPDSTHFGNDVYKLTGHVIVTGINESYRHQVFIQDATGAIVIDDQNSIITTPLEPGDEITNIYGKLSDYHGQLQFVVSEPYSDPALSIYNDVEPLNVTITDLQNNNFMDQHQSELIRLNEVTFFNTGVIANNQRYTVTQDGLSGEVVWIHFWNVPGLTGTELPTYPVNLTGVNKVNYNKYYLIPRSGADISTGLPQYLTENDVVLYPNPVSDRLTVSLRTNDFNVTAMAVYDLNGKLVLTKSVSDNQISVNTHSLAPGHYFLRLSDGKNSFTTKFVKQ